MKKSVTTMGWFDWWEAVIVLFFLFILLLPSRSFALTFSYESIDAKYAKGINDNGDIVSSRGSFNPYLLSGDNFYNLNPLGNDENGAFYGINDSGKIVGFTTDEIGYSGVYDTTLGVYTSFETFQYERSGDPKKTYAYDINDDGWIVGMCRYPKNSGDNPAQSHAFLRKDEVFSIIDYPGYAAASARGINDLGQIVGMYYNTGDEMWQGFHYDESTLVPFSSISVSGSNETKLYDVNNNGWIVGEYTDLGDNMRHGFVKIDDIYTEMIFPDANVTIPYGINSEGWIVGDYYKDGTYTAFLAKPVSEPVPEPTTILLLGSALIGLAAFRRKFRKI